MGRCCIKNCKSTSKLMKLHGFPKQFMRFMQWTYVVGRQDIEYSKRRNYHVCDLHFREDMRTPMFRSNLRLDAWPVLHLPDISTEQSAAGPCDTNSIPGPSFVEILPAAEERPSSRLSRISSPRTPMPHIRGDLKKRINVLRSVGSTRGVLLTPKARKLYKMTQNVIKIARKIDKESNMLVIKEAEQTAKDFPKFMKCVNKSTLNFFCSQARLQRLKKKGRRYTVEDKVFALSLMKQSGKGYRFLQGIFALPSRRLLISLLQQIPMNCGINHYLMLHLKTAVDKMAPRDRYCTLMFDEMHLSAGVAFDGKNIIGFRDLGEVTADFAEHALVFMIKGTFKKWKQPISFYFTSGGIKALAIKKLIKDNIMALQNIGLKVVSTVCDQMSANCTAVKGLKDDTAQDQIRTYGENKMVGFTINGEEIIPLFDPPHLLKCLRNNFIGNHIRFQWKNGMQMANWDDIVKFYEMGKDDDFNYRACPKLYKNHVYEEHMRKMKVQLAVSC